MRLDLRRCFRSAGLSQVKWQGARRYGRPEVLFEIEAYGASPAYIAYIAYIASNAMDAVSMRSWRMRMNSARFRPGGIGGRYS